MGVDAKYPFLFPGQGAQSPGMGWETANLVPAAKDLYSKASEILGYDLLQKCKEGPLEDLDRTEICQPAIFVTSMAAVERLRHEKGDAEVNKATCTLGLSLGEYSALCFAGAISFEDGVRITKLRGAAMQKAAEMEPTSMVSVIGLNSDTVAAICEKAADMTGKPIQIANYLCGGNYVTSGHKEACDAVLQIAKPEFRARLCIKIPVAGAFHTQYMAPAVEELSEFLKGVDVKAPRLPVISNVDAQAHSDPEEIKTLLAKQVTSPVLWENSMRFLLENGFESGYELGPGNVLAGILKRVDKERGSSVTSIM